MNTVEELLNCLVHQIMLRGQVPQFEKNIDKYKITHGNVWAVYIIKCLGRIHYKIFGPYTLSTGGPEYMRVRKCYGMRGRYCCQYMIMSFDQAGCMLSCWTPERWVDGGFNNCFPRCRQLGANDKSTWQCPRCVIERCDVERELIHLSYCILGQKKELRPCDDDTTFWSNTTTAQRNAARLSISPKRCPCTQPQAQKINTPRNLSKPMKSNTIKEKISPTQFSPPSTEIAIVTPKHLAV